MSMKTLYEIKDKLCKEMDEYADKKQLSMSDLQTLDTLAHATKNVNKIIESEQNEYSQADGMYGRYGYGREAYGRDGGYDRGNSYRRDSMGRYSREGDSHMMHKLTAMMDEAETPEQREAIRKCMEAMR